MKWENIYKKNPTNVPAVDGDVGYFYNQPKKDCVPKKLEFYILDRKKNKKNLLDICGVKLTTPNDNDLRFEFVKNDINYFYFTYDVSLNEFDATELHYNFGVDESEIQVYENNKIMFSGYVSECMQINFVNDSGLLRYNVVVTGSEKVYHTENLLEKTSWYNKTSEDILKDLNKTVKNDITHGFADWDISSNLKHKFQDNIQHSGQYSRLFDIIREKENATFGYYPHGKVKFIKDIDMSQGADIDNLAFGHSLESIEIDVDASKYANKVVFIADNIKGGLQKERVQFTPKPEKDSNDKKFSGTVPTAYNIYRVRRIETFGAGVHHSDWIYDPSYRYNKQDDKWRYNFNTNSVDLSIDSENVESVVVEYWRSASGVYMLDLETQVIKEFDRRELTSQHFVVEITNERIKSTQDMMEFMYQYLLFRQRNQVKVTMTIDDANLTHTLAHDYQDFYKYKFDWEILKTDLTNGAITPVKLLETQNLDSRYNSILVVRKKTFSLKIYGYPEDKFISLDRFKVKVELETDLSDNPEKIFLRDKHEWQRGSETRTINLVKHIEWSLNTSNSCDDKKQINQPETDFDANKTPDIMVDNPTGRLVLKTKDEQLIIHNQGKLDQTPSKERDVASPNCNRHGNGFSGLVFVNKRLPKQPALAGIVAYEYYPHADAGITSKEIGAWLDKKHTDVLGINNINPDEHYYVYVPNSGWHNMKRNPLFTVGLPEDSHNKKWNDTHVELRDNWIPIRVNLLILDKTTGQEATTWNDNTYFKPFIPDKIDIENTPSWIDPRTNKIVHNPIIKGSPESFKVHYSDLSKKITFEKNGKYDYWVNWKDSNPNRAITGKFTCRSIEFRKGYRHYYS